MARPDVTSYAWPPEALGEAMAALCAAAGLAPESPSAPPVPAELSADADALARWMELAAASLGAEADGRPAPYASLADSLRGSVPALVALPGKATGYLAVLGAGRKFVSLLGLDRRAHRCRLREVCAALASELEAPVAGETARLLDEIGVPPRRAARARAAILRQRLASREAAVFWRLRLPPGAGFLRQLRAARLPRQLAALSLAHLAQYVLWIVAWWLIGLAAMQGRLDTGLLIAWILLLATMVPLRLLAAWKQGVLAIGGGALLKKRLLAGALKLESDETRSQGAGQFLGRVIESQFVESQALSGGFLALVSALELVVAALVLALGAGGGLLAVLLVVWIVVSAAAGWRYYVRYGAWTGARLEMTHDLVERMVEHRTRLAQERPDRWHDGEDQMLERYLHLSRRMDASGAFLIALVPRGWLVVAMAALTPAFVSGAASAGALAVALGGILLAFRALKRLAAAMWQVVGAGIAWKQVAPLFHAAARPEVHGSPEFACAVRGSEADGRSAVLDARNLVFRYRGRGAPVLQGCGVTLARGDRVLLEGPSGGGKSTLAALLAGARQPESGLLLLNGLDRETLGAEGWRRRVAAAPQFHENHVLTGTFLFNALMGRRWPPKDKDISEMEAVCGELGLDPLLARMPAGTLQMVGESGWQLSHGEQSRLFIARALLQNSEVVVLDESFAALDPENLRLALQCVLRRARTLLVIAHR
jgi:ATP-binding cassette subfamily B protein